MRSRAASTPRASPRVSATSASPMPSRPRASGRSASWSQLAVQSTEPLGRHREVVRAAGDPQRVLQVVVGTGPDEEGGALAEVARDQHPTGAALNLPAGRRIEPAAQAL